ncbi:MAG: YwiC-like family protein [Anaerolineales bacterium]
MQKFLQRPIALPQDHGSWVFLFSPLLIGIFAGKTFSAASLILTLAAVAAFLIRQPLTVAVKAYAGRRPRSDLPAARFWMIVYGVILLLCALELIHLGYTMILWLALPAAPVFAWHLWLVSKRQERRQAGIEILATGVLALAAPAAFWVGRNAYDPLGWLLWILVWFQSAASIVYAYLRLEQRQWREMPDGGGRLRAGARALAYSGFNLLLAAILAFGGRISFWVWIPFLIQFGETLWGTLRPAVGAKPVAIGMRQLAVSALFTLAFILSWR